MQGLRTPSCLSRSQPRAAPCEAFCEQTSALRKLPSWPLLLASFLFPAPDDELARRLVRLASAIAKRRLAPRGLGVATWTRLALSATVRMVAGIHGRAAHFRTLAEPAAAACFAAGLVLM